MFNWIKKRTNDAILSSAIRLGVPEQDAQNILTSKIEELSKMLPYTTLPQSTVKDLKAHDRMAFCINAIYMRDKKTK